MKALLGRKLGMTQIFDDTGAMVPVTLVQAGPCVVTAIRTEERDGYTAVQIGYNQAKRLNKAQIGQLKPSGASSRYLKEVRGDFETKLGDNLDVTAFAKGDRVTLSGISKGKGFAGTIKRHNFSRGPMSHGGRNKRRPGSIGSMYPQKVFKGKKMAGRMGSEQVTRRKVQVEAVDNTQNLLAVRGAVPGRRGQLVFIRGGE